MIYLLVGEKQEGKTTSLQKWLLQKQSENKGGGSVGSFRGLLSPDKDGLRHFVLIGNNEDRIVEVSQKEVENNNSEAQTQLESGEIFKIGMCFYFKQSVFDWATTELHNNIKEAATIDKIWIIVDEIGPLEIKKEKGFDSVVKDVYSNLSLFAESKDKNVLFVVRKSMVEEFIEKYAQGNKESQSIINLDFIQKSL